MNVPKEIIIIGMTREITIKPKGAKFGQSETFEFRKNAEFVPWFFGVSKDHKTLFGWRYTMKRRENRSFVIDKGKTRGAFHRLEEYYIKTTQIKAAGKAVDIYYSSDKFDDPGHAGRPDEYHHLFYDMPTVYLDNQKEPSIFAIQYTPKRLIFGPNLLEKAVTFGGGTSAGIMD